MLLNLLDDINRITKKWCGKGVPVLLIFQARGVEILADDVKMQLPHRWNLYKTKHLGLLSGVFGLKNNRYDPSKSNPKHHPCIWFEKIE